MKITSRLFDAFLKCPTKCWLRFVGEQPTGNKYAEWVQSQTETYRMEGIRRLQGDIPAKKFVVSPTMENLRSDKWQVAAEISAQNGDLQTQIHALERMSAERQGKPSQLVPIRFIFMNKLTKQDKLLLAFDLLVLSEEIGREMTCGKLIHGDNFATLKVKSSPLAIELRKHIEKVTVLLSNRAVPELILNRHCAECEFQARCRQKAAEKDDLSLLAMMTPEQRKEFNQRGIFTVTQLSYTFRPRRRPKKLAEKREKYHHALKALAVREKKVHIVGTHTFQLEGTPIYLDVEGLPDRDFYYLIGIRFTNGQSMVCQNIWADREQDEKRVWSEFLSLLAEVQDPLLIHYGSYEKSFLERMISRYGPPPPSLAPVAKAVENSLNLLSIIFAQFYFPTYSNGLKEIAEHLGFSWSEPNACGTQSIAWRCAWEETKDSALRDKLITYNLEDCHALQLVTNTIVNLCAPTGNAKRALDSPEMVQVETLKRQTMWPKFSSPLPEFEQINKAARWDYQRDRVYVRSSERIRKLSTQKKRKARRLLRVASIVKYPESKICPSCHQEGFRHFNVTRRVLYDVHIGRCNLRRRIAEYHFRFFWCPVCQERFGFPTPFWPGSKFGRNLVAYLMYQSFELCIPMRTVREGANRLLGLGLTESLVGNFKRRTAKFYSGTHNAILERLRKGGLLQVDETRVSVKGKTAYVWVFTNLHEVTYAYSDTREGEFAHRLMEGFSGVLISDFYAAYDSFDCAQQKCLLHLIRDLNAEILDEPYDEELKAMVKAFAALLKPIIETCDRYGLKRYHLNKFRASVDRFYRQIGKADYQSQAAIKCRQRFERNRDKLFTFLVHDGIPWNNNNAEHAIKAFAKLRDIVQGSWTAKAVGEHLVLLSLCQTCKYQGLDFLNFLRSGEQDMEAFAATLTRRRTNNAELKK